MPYAPYRTKCLLLAALSLVPGAARAIEPLDTFSVSLGGYVTRFDTRVRVDGEALGGTRIDLSKDLGLDADDMIGFASMTWRPFARHEVGVSYFGNTVDADHRLQRDIVFDDKVYAASATQMQTFVRNASSKRAAAVFITNKTLPNPYGALPTYWSQEVSAVAVAP